MSTTKKDKPYRHLGRRIENLHNGICGTIVAAARRTDAKTGWYLEIEWDDGRHNFKDTDRDMLKYNRLVADDYKPDHGPIPERIGKLIKRIDDHLNDVPYAKIEWRRGFIAEVRIGRDHIGVWRPSGFFIVDARLWAGQGDWKYEAPYEASLDEALRELRNMLETARQTTAS